jgi:hypothetical protein
MTKANKIEELHKKIKNLEEDKAYWKEEFLHMQQSKDFYESKWKIAKRNRIN